MRKKHDLFQLDPSQILVLGFLIVIMIGAILLNLPIASRNGQSVGFINAFFTATSAVCVTGLVVVDTGTHWTVFGQTIIILLIQVGGLGFMTMGTFIAFLFGKKITLKERLVMKEALSQFSMSGIVRFTKYILITTFIIESIGAILLSFKFIPRFGWIKGIAYGIFHAISAFCNAGFDLIGNFSSLTGYVDDILVNFVICTLIIGGGLGYTVILEMITKKRFSRFSLHSKMVLSSTIILIVVGVVAIFLLEYNNPDTLKNLSFKGKFISSMFQSVSPRTAGFNTLPIDKMTMASIFFIILLMFIGGSPAGTAGGIKTTTAGVLILTIISVIKGKDDTEIFNRRIAKELINRALAVIGIAMMIVIIMTILLSITEVGFEFIEILFEVVSAFGTVGLSMGITSKLTHIGKILIAVTMFAGRVGPLTIAVALAKKQKKEKACIRYPEDKVIVG
ncbi:TrkH family potassium uptake protein [Anaerophilus nitritogenes]|uniref:TrkH family potassium uptake protein n=1 Tax=Anaerophilus nitritogenes TaxID=2498136 RepID=UPI003C12C0EB